MSGGPLLRRPSVPRGHHDGLPPTYQAPNRAQNLRTYFTSERIRAIPRVFEGETPPWEWGLTLTGYGAADGAQPVDGAALTASGNRIELARGAVTEWYVNDERGLKQGFTLHSLPAGSTSADATIVLALGVSGHPTANLTADGDAVEWTTPGRVRVLRYAELLVTDASGRELPSRFALVPGVISLVVDAAGVVYPITVDPLATTPAWTAESDQDGAEFGRSVGTAGDVNGDGYADVVVGAYRYDNGQPDEGAAFVYHGGAVGLGATAAWTAESDQADGWFGGSVGTAGDVNGDGYADVLVGASRYDNGETDEGAAFVYHGGATGLGTASAWTAESNQVGAIFGSSVGTAGDVNGDGYAEVLVGAPFYNNPEFSEGAAFGYHGGAAGLSLLAAWTAESHQVDAWFGISVATSGDVNSDGYVDDVVGASRYDNGETGEGRAFMYYGNRGAGLAARTQQRCAEDTGPMSPGGQVISPTEARLAALLRTPFGRSDVALQWEIKPEGTAFDGSGPSQSGWMDSGTAGASISQLVSGLDFETRYRWRVRILGRPRAAVTNSAVTYRSRWLNGSTFFTALSGQQVIAGTGPTTLLGQAANVGVASMGSPALTSLTLRGYPSTQPPNASSIPGYGAGTKILDRYFWLEPNSDAAGYVLTLCLNYDDSEVTAAGASEADLQLFRWTGSAWACRPRAASSGTSAHLVCADDVDAFSHWAVAAGAALAAMPGLSMTKISGDQVEVTWNAAAGATSYQVWYTSNAP